MTSLPQFSSYILSFIYVAIYWNNHHHMLHAVSHVTGNILWANMHLLFWLSLIPLTTEWMRHYPLAEAPTAIYGASLLLPAIAYFILQNTIIRSQGKDSILRRAIGKDIKGKISTLLYIAGVLLAFIEPALSDVIYVTVALIWLVPDKRIERALSPKL